MKATTLTLFDPAFLAQVPAVGSTNPLSFGPVARWYDADSLSLADNALISVEWDDKSLFDDDAVATSGREPTFKSTVLNGKPAVRFTVGTKHLAFEGGDLNLADFTILCIIKSTADSIFLSKNGVNRQVRINRSAEHKASWVAESGQEVVSNLFSSAAANTRMIGYRRSDTSNADSRNFEFFDNSTPVGRPLSSVSSALFQINQIGIIDGGPLNIDIGELVIYDKALTTSQIQLLYHDYFKPKFLLP